MDQAQQKAAEAAFNGLFNLLASKYTYVASMTLLVYEILITFDQEIVTVWFSPASLGKWLFIINRYISPILFSYDLYYQLHPKPTTVFCARAFLPSSILGILALSTVEYILILRTHALYRNNILYAVLIFLCLVSAVTMLSATVYMDAKLIQVMPTPPGTVGCLAQCTDPLCRKLLTAFWIPFFVCETLIFLLTLWKSYRSAIASKYSSTLVQVFFRDGFIYYIIVMSISVCNLLIWITAPISMVYMATSLMRSLQVSMGSRILLNIRGIMLPGYATGTQISSIHMAQRTSVLNTTSSTSQNYSYANEYGIETTPLEIPPVN